MDGWEWRILISCIYLELRGKIKYIVYFILCLGTPSGSFIDFAKPVRHRLLAPPRGCGARELGNIEPPQNAFGN